MNFPSPKIVVVIAVDPMKSHRAVEALRIALGLGSHNEGKDLRLILCGRAPFLLAEDVSEVIEGDILEKHLPVFLEWKTPFYISTDASSPARYAQDCINRPLSPSEIAAFLEEGDRVLIFS